MGRKVVTILGLELFCALATALIEIADTQVKPVTKEYFKKFLLEAKKKLISILGLLISIYFVILKIMIIIIIH